MPIILGEKWTKLLHCHSTALWYNALVIMENLSFEWDNNKAKSNEVKHGITFEEAKTVFYDTDARVIPDPDHSITENRFIILGISHSVRILIVVHCYSQNDSVIRIISARKAGKNEQKTYWKNKSL